MKQIELKSLYMENFKGVKNRQMNFGNKTVIKGQNAAGKTSIVDAFTWLLFDKDSTGATKFQVRPLDENGDPIHFVEIKSEATILFDGNTYTLTKVQKEKWVKKRGSEEQEFQGNVNEFAINGYPKTEKDFKAFVADIVDEKLFRMITSPTVFTSMPWKEQREILFKLVPEINDYDIASQNTGFELLIPELQVAKIDDIRAKYTKSKNELNKKLVELPARIDEVSKQIVFVDVAELELQKKAIEEQIAALRKQFSDYDSLMQKHKEKADNLLHLKFQLSDMERAAEQALNEKKSRLKNELSKKNLDLITAVSNSTSKEKLVESCLKQIEDSDTEKENLKNDFNKTKELEVDPNSLVCRYCGQNFPEDKQQQVVDDFEKHKKDDLARIIARAKVVEANANSLQEQINNYKAELITLNENIESVKAEIADIEKEINLLPEHADFTGPEYAELHAQIEEAEKAINDEYSANDMRESVQSEIDAKIDELNKVCLEIAKSDCSLAEQRKAELENEQIETGQLVANCERMLYLLDKFTKLKLDLISNIVNEKFEIVNFKLFRTLINGGVEPCCECTFNGVPLSVLNSGHRIVAGIDIINTLSNIFGISAPVFVDNAETINDYNIPEYPGQITLLKVTEDKEIKVEV